jgi:predicted TPR repeat methyltransferase
MDRQDDQARAMAEAYDEEAAATGWLGPEVVFDLASKYIRPGQQILDIGIGTGLGSIPFHRAGLKVCGMDISREMLDVCRRKGFTDLTRHDLMKRPYPYSPESMDCVICLGVLQFFRDLSPVFEETARILRKGGLFIFVIGDRAENEAMEVVVEAELTNLGVAVTMYRHSVRQIKTCTTESGFVMLRDLPFTVYMDSRKRRSFPVRAHLVRKKESIGQYPGGDA